MTMPQMQKTISNLRLLLASITAKEDELEALARQFQRQLDRAPRYAIQGGNPLDATLNLMGEIQERLDDVQAQRKHLASIRRQAESELEALTITDKIAQAKSELASLKACETTSEDDTAQRIAELERFIQEASIRAGEAVAKGFSPPHL